MTDREKAIVMAHTGICMLTGEKFNVFHKYIEEILERSVYTHELAFENIQEEIKEKSKPDFIKLCRDYEPEKETPTATINCKGYGQNGCSATILCDKANHCMKFPLPFGYKCDEYELGRELNMYDQEGVK